MARHETDDEKESWAAYMREYRAKNPQANRRNNDLAPTPRQIEILRIYADPERGGTQAKVAKTLGISQSAVHNQLQRLMRRLDVHSPAQAVMKLWVNPDEPVDQTYQAAQHAPGRRLRRTGAAIREDRPRERSSSVEKAARGPRPATAE